MDRLTDWHPYIETLTETLKRDRETDTHTHTQMNRVMCRKTYVLKCRKGRDSQRQKYK